MHQLLLVPERGCASKAGGAQYGWMIRNRLLPAWIRNPEIRLNPSESAVLHFPTENGRQSAGEVCGFIRVSSGVSIKPQAMDFGHDTAERRNLDWMYRTVMSGGDPVSQAHTVIVMVNDFYLTIFPAYCVAREGGKWAGDAHSKPELKALLSSRLLDAVMISRQKKQVGVFLDHASVSAAHRFASAESIVSQEAVAG